MRKKQEELDAFLATQASLPTQIDPEALYVGLPTGWVSLMECVGRLEDVPDSQLLPVQSGRELIKLLR